MEKEPVKTRHDLFTKVLNNFSVKKIVLLLSFGIILTACDATKTASSIKKGNTNILKDTSNNSVVKKTDQQTDKKENLFNVDDLVFEEIEKSPSLKIQNIVEIAKSFHGTPYKFGGTTRKGMDCSGLVYVSFQEEDIVLPRSSHEIAKKGTKISLNEVAIGDLLFFKTNGRKQINHVGLVVDVYPGKVIFIHSSTSQGVIISDLDETYWHRAFTEARRII